MVLLLFDKSNAISLLTQDIKSDCGREFPAPHNRHCKSYPIGCCFVSVPVRRTSAHVHPHQSADWLQCPPTPRAPCTLCLLKESNKQLRITGLAVTLRQETMLQRSDRFGRNSPLKREGIFMPHATSRPSAYRCTQQLVRFPPRTRNAVTPPLPFYRPENHRK